jgi:alpha-tubulin suppressor-like RCC1 family protein
MKLRLSGTLVLFISLFMFVAKSPAFAPPSPAPLPNFDKRTDGLQAGDIVSGNQPAVITGFSPASGTIGTVVTISGTNFSPVVSSNLVRFGGFRSTVLAAGSNSLTVVVPTGATRSPLTVTVNGMTAYANVPFLVTCPNAATKVVAWGFNDEDQTNVPSGLTNVVAIAAAACNDHNLALKTDGTMVAWGYNNHGQATVPAGLSNVVIIAAGGYHNLVLKNDGTVAAWGYNSDWNGAYGGQATVPAGLSNAVAIGAGWYYSLGLKPDGTVLAWGVNSNGQTNVPAGLSNVVAIAGAPCYSLALKVDGTVVAWGTNYNTPGGIPVQLMDAPPGLSNVVAIAAGYFHCLALKADGTVVVWGENYYDQTNVPAGLTNVVAIAAGSYNNLALKADGKMVGWGFFIPDLPPSGLTNVVAVGAGYYHSLALVSDSSFGAPSIISQPTNQTVVVGGTANFNVTASGTPPLSCQWAFNGTNIAGATNTTLTLTNVQLSQAGNYAVLVTNLYGFILSSNAVLMVNLSPLCNPPPSGLVGWWPGEGNANDSVGTNNGTLVGGATFANGKVGLGFRLDGTNGYVQIPDSDALKPANVTIEAWVWLDPNVNTGPSGESIIFKRNSWTFLFEGYSLLKQSIDNGNGTYTDRFQSVVTRNGNQVVINSTTVVQRGVWYHVAATYDGNKLTLYVNGVAEASAVAGFALDYGTRPVFIGTTGEPAPYTSIFAGIIDEPSIYNRALSTNEIQAIYNAGSAGKCVDIAQPRILVQPQDRTVLNGANVQFAVVASGTPPLSYQWRLNGTNIVMATGSSLNLTAQKELQGIYDVVISNAFGTVTSFPRRLFLSPGRVVAWGWNEYGQTIVPPGLSDVVSISGGELHSLALRSDGTVFAWGAVGASNGDQGSLDFGQAIVPSGLSNIVAIAAGGYHNLVLKSDGTVAAWGAGTNDPTTSDNSAALSFGQNIVPHGLSNVVAIAGSLNSSLALKSDGTLLAWGNNWYGQTNVPAGLSNVVSVSAGDYHFLALKADGTVVAWGGNLLGSSIVPAGLGGVVAIAAGGNNSLALKGDGTIVGWGDNSYGVTVAPANATNVIAIAASFDASVALKNDGTVAVWGNTQFGEQNVPPGLVDVAAIASGGLHELALGTVPTTQLLIISQPTNVTVAVGGTANFSITASGTAPLSYQWTFNGTNLVGATNSTLILADVQPALAGNYAVLVTNLYGSALSSNAVLTVIVPAIPPTILSQTPSEVVLLGNAATFSVTAGGTDPLSYFWKRDGSIIPGATNFSYTLNNAQLSDSGSKFSCLVTNAYGSAASTNATLKVIDTIANDLCSGAIIITNASYTNVQSTLKASAFGDPVPDCVDGFGHGVWYQFTAPVAGLLIVDTFGSDFDTGLAIYSGSCDSLIELACNDDTGGITSQVILPTTAGTTYSILAGGYSSDAGNLVLHLNHLTPPAFAVQPTNQSVVVSSNASFLTTVSGTQPISFQWYFNNAPLVDGGRISGSTNATLNIAGIQTGDAGSYQLVASNIVGVATSSVAVLTPIILPPVITQQPTNQSVLTGSNVTFTAVVDGTPPYNYQWYFESSPLTNDGVHIFGSTTSSLSISNLTTADGGYYNLVVTNVSGMAVSDDAVLTVMVPPTILTQPIGRSVPPGLPTTFSFTASGNPAPAYHWLLNGTNIPGATVAAYTIPAVSTNQIGYYQVVASNAAGVETSSVAQLTFGPVAAWGMNTYGESLPPPGLSNVIAVAGTYMASFAVRTDGNIVPWGKSQNSTNVPIIPAIATNVVAMATTGTTENHALRSDGTVVSLSGFVVPGLSNIVSIAAGHSFTYALRAEGTLTNYWGSILTPGFPAGLNHVTAIAAGYNNAVALRNDGTIAVAGIGPVTNLPGGLTNVVAVAAGYTYAMALKADGTMVAWGSGTATNLPAGLTNVIAISAGNYSGENFGLAIRSNGTVVAWGDNPYGETNPPAALTNLISIAVTAAAYHGLALINDGSPVILHPPVGLTAYTCRDVVLRGNAAGAQPLNYQWLLNGTNVPGATNTSLVISNVQSGNAGNYQLFVSNAVNTALSLPAPLTVISNNALVFLSVPASQTNYQGNKISLGVTVLGNGPLRYQWFFSVTNKNYAAISGAANDTLVLDPALAVNTGNYYVAVSNQFTGITNTPVSLRVLFARAWGFQAVSNPPVNVTNAIAIATGGSYANPYGLYFALGSDGKLTSWANYYTYYGETNVSALSNSTVIAIAAGNQTSLALRSDGTVYAWGYGYYGQTNPPSGLNNVVAIACGDYHDLALKSDGTVIAWGQNLYGEGTNSLVATNAAVAIAAGTSHNLGLRADGTVFGWGYNSYGQTAIPFNASNVIAIAAGQYHSLALRANGTAVGWGNNGNGQVSIPAGLSNVVAISASGSHSTLLRADGTVLSLGYEYTGYASNAVPSDLANVIAISSGGDHDFGLLGTRAPAITVQPWNRTIFNTTTSVWFAAKCAGVQPVRYQWQLNGTNLPAATNDTLTVTSFVLGKTNLPIQSGTYQLIASNAYGAVTSKPAKLTVTIPLGEALDATNRVWTTSGNAPWYGQAATTHDGVDAARSGAIGALQETILQTTLATNWSGRCTFWWKVSSEQYFDILEFRVNGIVQTNISGEVDRQQVSIPVATGTNVLQWRYSKDASFDAGQDAGWVDQFTFVADGPIITLQPVSQTVNMGTTVTFRVTATAGKLICQWRQNGNIVGYNSPVLTLFNVGRAQNGTYSVTVTDFNTGGSTVSSNAVLKVLVPQLLGSLKLLPDGTLQFTSTDANGGLLSPSDLANFEAQASTNLVDWVPLTNALSLTNGMLQLRDNSGTNWPARFYRLIEH